MSENELNKQQEAFFVQNQMNEPKSTQGVFDLPCGYLSPDGELITEVKVREITGVEEDMLAAKNINGGKKITQLIGNCLERLGPMTDKPILLNCARNLTVGDRVFLMMAIRRVSLGDEFPFEAVCDHCEKKSLFMVNLDELTTKKMADPKKRVFDETLPSGKKIRWHVMTGKEEEIVAKYVGEDRLSLALLVRLDSIDGKPIDDIGLVKSLNLKDRNFLRDLFNEVEGGIDTSVDLTCPQCGDDFATDVDPGQAGFFFPSRTLKNSKRNTSSSSKRGKDSPTPNS